MKADASTLDEADRDLVSEVDAAMAEAARRAGALFGCRPGRTDCCRGPFPVNLLDARRLQRGLRSLVSTDPPRAEAVQARSCEAVARLAASLPGDAANGLLGPNEAAEEEFCAAHSGDPCPALDPATGLCDLYEWRPLACRTMGPPVRIGGVDLPPCPFCFVSAGLAGLERCRAVPDPRGREDALLARLERRSGLRGETFVAFVLAGRLPVL